MPRIWQRTILVREKSLARVAEVSEMNDVHVEMASDLLVNLTDRKVEVVRFEEKRINSGRTGHSR